MPLAVYSEMILNDVPFSLDDFLNFTPRSEWVLLPSTNFYPPVLISGQYCQ